MCWITHKPVTKLIAGEDINVYKVVYASEKGCMSFYNFYNYLPKEVYNVQIVIEQYSSLPFDIIFKISIGFHSYKSLKMFHFNTSISTPFLSIESINNKSRLDCMTLQDNIRIANFVIPKGSAYYENEFGEIVSDSILFEKYISTLEIKGEQII